MTQATQKLTFEEYLAYDDGTDTRYELVDGELIALPPESRRNHRIASFLFEAFLKLGIPSSLLTIGVQIAVVSPKASARQPDLVVLSEECAVALEGVDSDLITAAMPNPSLVVEVVSPGEPGDDNYDRDYIEKPKEYAQRDIPEYWIVDPIRAVVSVLTLKGRSYKTTEFRGSDRIQSEQFKQLELTAQQILSTGKK
ncbi:MAG: Uma2 family endonuclease [Leptolyngbyaceae cyanobacterium SM1_3_5]|nr:Uma2 family endonuclease [Leptolyngbyaceae cyanobacterium SM1_3_5]